MKYIVFSFIILVGSFAFGVYQEENANERFNYALSIADKALHVENDEDKFKAIVEIAIGHLRNTLEGSSQRDLSIANLSQLVESAKGLAVYDSLRSKVNSL